VAQVDADPRPRARTASHGVDKDVIHLQQRRGLGMPRLPPLQTGERVFFVLRLRDGDERLRRPAAPGPFLLRRGGLTSRRRYPRRFTTLLPEMWRPRRIAESGRFVCGGQLEQFIERSRSSIDTRRRVALLGET